MLDKLLHHDVCKAQWGLFLQLHFKPNTDTEMFKSLGLGSNKDSWCFQMFSEGISFFHHLFTDLWISVQRQRGENEIFEFNLLFTPWTLTPYTRRRCLCEIWLIKLAASKKDCMKYKGKQQVYSVKKKSIVNHNKHFEWIWGSRNPPPSRLCEQRQAL